MHVLLFVTLSLLCSAATAATEAPRILVLGDSISAAHGVASEQGWVGRLRERLEREGYRYDVVNASVGGDTTSGGRSRLPQALDRHQPAIVVIELGGNDGLRGLPLDAMEANLLTMTEQVRAAGAKPLLLGIRLPPNYGPTYVDRFTEVYRRVAAQTDVPLMPRVLEGVGERREWMQPDGIHPNADGHLQILENVWPALEPLLDGPDETAMRDEANLRKPGSPRSFAAGVLRATAATSTTDVHRSTQIKD